MTIALFLSIRTCPICGHAIALSATTDAETERACLSAMYRHVLSGCRYTKMQG